MAYCRRIHIYQLHAAPHHLGASRVLQRATGATRRSADNVLYQQSHLAALCTWAATKVEVGVGETRVVVWNEV